MSARLTAQQRAALDVLEAEPRRGFDCDELARRLSDRAGSPIPREGAATTAASLVRRGLAVRFVGGVGRQRVHFQAAP